ncbi:MAG: NAD(P)H-hydrate dehydratase [Candidatus Bathyarchaeota archaeon]
MILGEFLTVREMVAVEKNAAYLGVPTQLLMENAGRSVADEVRKRFKPDLRVTVVSGLSGNGGDGYVAARHLAVAGYRVNVIVLGDPAHISHPNTRVSYDALAGMTSSVNIEVVTDSSLIPSIDADIIVDGLIGTSMRGALRPPFQQMVEAINRAKAYRVAVDIPTGMEADTGEARGGCVHADLTVTFHKPKAGYTKKPKNVGELVVAPIGVPPEAEQYIGPGDVWAVQPSRDPDAHKGMFGSLLVVGGSETYSGAPALTALGAYAAGIDLVYVAVPETAAPAVMGFSPSLITVKLKGDHFTEENLHQIEPFLGKVDAVAVGPGLGQSKDTVEAYTLLHSMIQSKGLPMVVDADSLKAYPVKRLEVKTPTVFTPHSREFKILTGKEAPGGFKEKGAVVQREAEKLGAVILLKGRVDVVSDGQRVRYNWTGNPGMTVGGTGDVLTGLTGAYLAMGASAFDAACAAAFINGAAGDRVAAEKGYHLLPEDLVAEIPYVIEECLG